VARVSPGSHGVPDEGVAVVTRSARACALVVAVGEAAEETGLSASDDELEDFTVLLGVVDSDGGVDSGPGSGSTEVDDGAWVVFGAVVVALALLFEVGAALLVRPPLSLLLSSS